MNPTDSNQLSINSYKNTKPYSLNNFQVCPDLQSQLKYVAIRYVSSQMLKSLLSIKGKDVIQARNRMDIPHGLFGFSLENFYERRKLNAVYLDILDLVSYKALGDAKFCIVLDDMQDYLKRLFLGFLNNDMNTILMDIANTQKLLVIDEIIAEEFKVNTTKLTALNKKLSQFTWHARETTIYSDNLVFDAQNKLSEEIEVLNPIQFRYKLSYYNRTGDQIIHDWLCREEQQTNELNFLKTCFANEAFASDSVRMQQSIQIENLKHYITAMQKKYDNDSEDYESRISYKTTQMQAMGNKYTDCLLRLVFFAEETVKLIEWEEEYEAAQRRKAQKLIQDEIKREQKAKEKEDKRIMRLIQKEAQKRRR